MVVSTDASTLISLQGLRKSYNLGLPSEAEVLHGLDLQVGQGEFVALMGPSGSGKSTLLNILGLLEPMTSGSYQLQGEEVRGLDDAGLTLRRRSALGFVFQFHHLLPAFTALENVTLPSLMCDGHVTAKQRDYAREMLAEVGLAQAENKRPGELSGGMQQRVAIARAVIGRPDMLVADEPTGNVDPEMALKLLRLFEALNRLGTTVVVATHDVHLLRKVPESLIMRLDKGRLSDPTGALRYPPRREVAERDDNGKLGHDGGEF